MGILASAPSSPLFAPWTRQPDPKEGTLVGDMYPPGGFIFPAASRSNPQNLSFRGAYIPPGRCGQTTRQSPTFQRSPRLLFDRLKHPVRRPYACFSRLQHISPSAHLIHHSHPPETVWRLPAGHFNAAHRPASMPLSHRAPRQYPPGYTVPVPSDPAAGGPPSKPPPGSPTRSL